MLPRMTIGGDSVFVHYPAVGAEGELELEVGLAPGGGLYVRRLVHEA